MRRHARRYITSRRRRARYHPDILTLRITYERYADVRADEQQMARGGVLVRVADIGVLAPDTPASLELVFPDGRSLSADVKVLQVLDDHGVAVTVTPELVAAVHHANGTDAGTAPAHHERLDANASGPLLVHELSPPPPRAATQPPLPRAATQPPETKQNETQAAKIHLAMHGNRDQRNAILRDQNRTLYPYVLKNPQLTTDDVIAIAKNAQMTPDVLKMIAERREWFQRPQIAIALARNPKTPPDVAVRALDYVPLDVLRQIAKGAGALPHVVTAARKKTIK